VAAHLEERRRTHERQALLIRELHHRVKNTLAIVQGLLGATVRSSRSIDEFYRSFSDRIVAIAKTHNLLNEEYWQTAPLEQMLRSELSPYEDGSTERIVLSGPLIELPADLAVPLGMAVHELTTNAAKHGALSAPGGKVEVIWRLTDLNAERRLDIDWIERNGPPVAPPRRKGFGSTLLQRILTHQCRGTLTFDYDPAGLRCQVGIPLLEERLSQEAG
jgi:two-component sensor histidine kinase